MSSGVGSDPKDSKAFLMKGKSFSKILYKILYETEIVTFQKILTIGELYSSDGGKKDKTKWNGLWIQILVWNSCN